MDDSNRHADGIGLRDRRPQCAGIGQSSSDPHSRAIEHLASRATSHRNAEPSGAGADSDTDCDADGA